MTNSKRMYYAEFDHGEGVDLWRFKTEQERDAFISESPSCAWPISSKDARRCHKEQFKYWNEEQ